MNPTALMTSTAPPRRAATGSAVSHGAEIRLRPPTAGRRSPDPTVSVVIPALDESSNITPLIQGLPGCVTEIIVVDRRSADDTVQVALDADPRVRVVLERRRGKAIAMLTGFASATADVIVAIDADRSMDPGEVPMFRAALALGYDLVKGSREAVGGGSNDFSPVRRLGNGTLTRFANVLHRTRWSDPGAGSRPSARHDPVLRHLRHEGLPGQRPSPWQWRPDGQIDALGYR